MKGGILWKDFERDGKSVLTQSAPGFLAGIEIRLGAEERTYFKPAAYVTRMQVTSQSHFNDTQIFNIEDGYDMLTGAIGLETRLIDAGPLAWRMSFTGYVEYVANIRGNVTFEDLATLVLGLQIGTGLDVGAFVFDINLQGGLNSLMAAIDDSYPIAVSLTAGFSF